MNRPIEKILIEQMGAIRRRFRVVTATFPMGTSCCDCDQIVPFGQRYLEFELLPGVVLHLCPGCAVAFLQGYIEDFEQMQDMLAPREESDDSE